ncbi:hypothetical protein MTO96_034071 [Rhipicephalus appendiculatus]
MKIGMENESSVIKRYKQLRNVDVHAVGLCVNPGAPFLGASPDGLVWYRGISDYGLLEVKTLAKAMEEGLSVEEAIEQKRALFLKTGKLSHRHKYFYQIQGQLGITGMQYVV